ncbi:M1 family metallopeptidase [Alkalinema sp. FACHB-956]|uniref:M1 family metallopeptidase n=1 Tax=Alkalinema sp. FACHB-956 TaxID=2692768 RepID=UPI0016881441|nr:M1 family metallopeptidase [Alkalinema sp. FACHB-956]MBD2325586.1 M1 family metallopeptidase [Alkalinema sp. FACHB-956]
MMHLGLDTQNHRRFELPGARPQYTPDRPGQVHHIFLDLVLDLAQHTCQGRCQIKLVPIRSGLEQLTLDAVDLQIQDVRVGGETQIFDYDGQQIQVHLSQPTQQGQAIDLEIHYGLQNPQRGLYFVAPNEHYPHKPVQAWTQGEDEDSRYWFPCFDYPGQLASSEIRVEVAKPYQVVSNGELINTESKETTQIFHWLQQEVHPTYLMTIAVGDFAELQDEWQGKPVTYYVEKGQEAAARLTMGKTPAMLDFFSQTYGYPYPYSKYAQVCVDDYIFGGMENTSMTLLTDRCLLDERAAIDSFYSETLVAHELAHQWFGDLAVIKHWSHAWIKEGMASYAEVLWLSHAYGEEVGRYYLLGQAEEYLDEDASRYRRPLVTHVYREAIELYDRHIYEKGSCVYHMIRAELGDELFFKTIATFLQDHAHRTVETVDLLRAIEKATGRNLLFLFDQYVYRGGHPDYKVTYSWDSESNLAKFTVIQTQVSDGETDGLFDLKIPIGFGWQDGTVQTLKSQTFKFQTFTVRIQEREQSFYFPLAKKPDFVRFDVGNHVLKTVQLDYPLPELKAQLQQDPDPIARIYAARSLGKKGGLEAVKALATALTEDSFWGVRVEVARSLGKITLDQVVDALVPGLQDPQAQVRKAVIETLAQLKIPTIYPILKSCVVAGDASYPTEAAAIASLGTIAASGLADAPPEAEVLELLRSVLTTRQGWNDVVRIGAVQALSRMKQSAAALDLLLEYTALGISQALRLAAIRALGAISSGQTNANIDRILDRLQEVMREPFFLTRVAVIVALEQMQTPRAIGILQGLLQQTADGRLRRMAEEAIQAVQERIGTDPSVKQLREDLDQIRRENQDLKSRLAALEAKTAPANIPQ